MYLFQMYKLTHYRGNTHNDTAFTSCISAHARYSRLHDIDGSVLQTNNAISL